MKLSELELKQTSKDSLDATAKYRVLGEDYLTTGVSNEQAALAVKRKYQWNWDNSLRSNCDDFLETLEYDIVPEQYFKRKN